MSFLGSVVNVSYRYTLGIIDSKLDDYSPILLMTGAALTAYAVVNLKQYQSQPNPKPLSAYAGKWLQKIPFIQTEVQNRIRGEFRKFKKEIIDLWKPFGKPYLQIPEGGLPQRELIQLIDSYTQLTMKNLVGRHVSGTIYPNELNALPPIFPSTPIPEEITYRPPNDLNFIFTYAFQRTQLFNALHTKEFAIGSFIKHQVIQMVSHAHGGCKYDVMGFVTRGGSESNMIVVRAMKNWGEEQGITCPAIIAPDSIHASIIKGGEAYGVQVILIPTNRKGEVDMKELKEAAKRYSTQLVGLLCSTPSYAKGVIDPVLEFARIARDQKIPLHVDCCLGGFIGEYIHRQKFLAIDGVTSISVDTHKNGCAPKGSSVLVTKPLSNKVNFSFYAFYAIPGWTGGIYGTPSDAGSEPVTPSLQALLAILSHGEKGYREKAIRIRNATLDLAKIVKNSPRLNLIRDPDLHVIVFEINPDLQWREGAIYELAHQLEKRSFTFNNLLDEALHFCITDRFASDKSSLKKLELALKESLDEVEKLNANSTIPFAKARMYCSLRQALTPNVTKQSWNSYFVNRLFGKKVAEETVKSFYCALSNPHSD